MHRNPTPHTWIHRNHPPSSKCTGILPLTHECTENVTPQVNVPESYPHTWLHRNRHSSGDCTEILPHTHEGTEIIIPDVNAPESDPSHMNALKSSLLRSMHQNPTLHTWMHRNHHSSSKYTGILPCTHECTEIIIPQVNARESYPSHMNAPKSSFLGQMHRYPTLNTGKYNNHHSSSRCTGIPLTHECIEIVTPQVNAPSS